MKRSGLLYLQIFSKVIVDADLHGGSNAHLMQIPTWAGYFCSHGKVLFLTKSFIKSY